MYSWKRIYGFRNHYTGYPSSGLGTGRDHVRGFWGAGHGLFLDPDPVFMGVFSLWKSIPLFTYVYNVCMP